MSTQPNVRFLDHSTPPHIATLIILTSLSALTMNIFLPSLPNMATYFETDYALMQLSVPVYFAVNAALQVVVGPISDRYGRRPVILTGISLFLLATLGCILAPSAEIYLAFRMGQGAIVVAMVLGRAVVRDMVPANEAASMIGYVTMGMALVPMIGPAFGGVLDDAFGWQANFWVLFIAGCATLALTWFDLGETAQRSDRSLWGQFKEYPELLRSPRFWGYSLSAAFASGAFFAYLGGAPYIGTTVFGLSPSTLGFFLGAPAVGYFLGNFLTGRFSARIGFNTMIYWGCLINVTGIGLSLLFFLVGHGSAFSFFGFMTLVGLGNGMVIPNATAGMLSVRAHLAGTASGLGGALMVGGGAVLSLLPSFFLKPGAGAYPLIYIMLLTSIGAVIAIHYVTRRQKSLGL